MKKFPVRAVDIVNPGIQWRFIRTWHTLININNITNFNSCRVCLIFYIRFCELQKASGITLLKKMLLATALSILLRDVYSAIYQNKPAAVAPKETITIISSFLELMTKKTVNAAKICGGAENVVKTKPQQTFVKWIMLGFITLGIYILRWKRRCVCSQLHELPIDMGNSICTAH